jgi:nudix-type nucleoside diphosphatase (YffH/AdpP family)
MPKVEVISRRRVFDGFFKIDEARLRFERYDGSMGEEVRRLNFERGDSAAALLVDGKARKVYLVEQFMYPTLAKAGGWMETVAAGMIEKGETPKQAIRREILEETGFAAKRIEAIATFFVSPGGSSERIFLFCALISYSARVAAGGGVASEHEDIKLVAWRVDKFLARIAAGGFPDAKTIVAGYWLKDNLARIAPRRRRARVTRRLSASKSRRPRR